VLDTSAVVSMIVGEAGNGRLFGALAVAAGVAIGTPALLEAAMVLIGNEGEAGRVTLDQFLRDYEVASIPFDDHHRVVAVDAFVRFGKGQHPARLNYGDCMTYATARVADAPLLFVGQDFAKTDLTPALA
jgi:ribonuclease VapC